MFGSSFWTGLWVLYRMFIDFNHSSRLLLLILLITLWSAIILLVFSLLKLATTLCYNSAEIDSFCSDFGALFTYLIYIQISWNFDMSNFYLLITDLEIFSWFHWKTNAQQFFKVQFVYDYVARIFSKPYWFCDLFGLLKCVNSVPLFLCVKLNIQIVIWELVSCHLDWKWIFGEFPKLTMLLS